MSARERLGTTLVFAVGGTGLLAVKAGVCGAGAGTLGWVYGKAFRSPSVAVDSARLIRDSLVGTALGFGAVMSAYLMGVAVGGKT
jgi:hypothetical protein